MPIELLPPPYSLDALEPFISAEGLTTHYTKHHANYVNTLNKLIENTIYASMNLEDIVVRSGQGTEFGTRNEIFNNASQVWNHSFYWNSMTDARGHVLSNEFEAKLKKTLAA